MNPQVHNKGSATLVVGSSTVTVVGELRIDSCLIMLANCTLKLQSNVSGRCSSLDVPEGGTLVLSPISPQTVVPAIIIKRGGGMVRAGAAVVSLQNKLVNAGKFVLSGSGKTFFNSNVRNTLPTPSVTHGTSLAC